MERSLCWPRAVVTRSLYSRKPITLMKPSMSMNCWGVYLKLGVPLRSDLPLLLYVGSATGCFGLAGRFKSHIYSMATCTS